MKKTYFPMLLALILAAVLLFLTSCDRTYTVTGDNIGEYVIVRPDNASYDLRAKTTDVWKAIRKSTGVELTILKDSESADCEKKILIGENSSDEYDEFTRDMRLDDYAYGMIGDTFIITGRTDDGTILAADEYCKYIRSLTEEESPLFGGGVTFEYRGEYELTELTINGADVRDYRAVYPRNMIIQKTLAEKIADTVLAKTGFPIGVISDKEDYDGKRIYISIADESMAEDEYTVTSDENGNITVCGGGDKAIRSGVKLICDKITEMNGSGSLIADDSFIGKFEESETFSVMTFNILEFNAYLRIDAVVNTILKYMPDSIGFQEMCDSWMYELSDRLGEYYDYYHTMPIDEQPIFYLKDKWTMIDAHRYALSDTPDIDGTMVAGGQHARSIYIMLLERKSDGFRYYHVNTHFQPMNDGQKARANEATVVARLTDVLEDYPTFFTGDLNSSSEEEAHHILVGHRFYSTEVFADEILAGGSSWCGDYYDINRTWSDRGSPIDYVYVKSPWVHTLSYKVIREPIGGMYPSDHFPVIAVLEPVK